MSIVDLNPSSQGTLYLHYLIFIVTALLSLYLIRVFFFEASAGEQDQYYLRGGVIKMVKLKGKPTHIGGKYWLYRATLADENKVLGADMQKVEISFDYVSDQDVKYDPKLSGRYPVETFGAKGYFEIIEQEGSEIDQIFRRNLEDGEKPFEFSIKGPSGNLKYLGNSVFLEYDSVTRCRSEKTVKPSTLIFIAQAENIQAFFKVLKDLELHKVEKVILVYLGDSAETMPFLAEVEYWMKATKWTIDVVVSSHAPEGWSHGVGELDSALPFKRLPPPTSSAHIFVSVYHSQKANLSDRLSAKGYKGHQIHWVN